MCAFQTDLYILKDYDAHFFQAHSSEKRTLITGTEVLGTLSLTGKFPVLGTLGLAKNNPELGTAFEERNSCTVYWGL